MNSTRSYFYLSEDEAVENHFKVELISMAFEFLNDLQIVHSKIQDTDYCLYSISESKLKSTLEINKCSTYVLYDLKLSSELFDIYDFAKKLDQIGFKKLVVFFESNQCPSSQMLLQKIMDRGIKIRQLESVSTNRIKKIKVGRPLKNYIEE